jgi:hypothetical protein
MTYGAGSIGRSSISTLSKNLRDRLTPKLGQPDPLALDKSNYTIQEVATKARDFFKQCYDQAYTQPVPGYFLGYRISGYSAPADLPESWEIRLLENSVEGPEPLYDPDQFGPRWSGETEALDRLILGVGSKIGDALVALGADPATVQPTISGLVNRLSANLYLPAMPIQDAIDLARFLAETAIKFTHFSLRPATVGGPVEIATITKH